MSLLRDTPSNLSLIYRWHAGSHHAFLLGQWLSDAESWAVQASTAAHADTLMADARRVITLWGHPDSPQDPNDSHLSQYSYRLWVSNESNQRICPSVPSAHTFVRKKAGMDHQDHVDY